MPAQKQKNKMNRLNKILTRILVFLAAIVFLTGIIFSILRSKSKTKDALQDSEKIFLNQAEFKIFSSQKSKVFTKIGKLRAATKPGKNGKTKIVLEMGQDHMGDIHLLSQLAKPHIGVVTLIGEAHLEFFGSRDQIAKGKMQIVDGMDSDGILIAPADPIIDPYLPTRQMVMRFGDGAEIFVKDLQESKHSLTFTTNVVNRPITLPVPGKYNATNAMVAAYVGKLLAIADDDIVEALENIELTRNRTEWKKAANGADILSDVYNANPTAMRLILETFTKIPANEGGKKIAVLADMKELGEQSVDLHKQMIMSLSPDQLDTLIFYGEDIAELAKLASQMFPIGKVYYFKKTADEDQFDLMLETLQKVLQPADQVLLKGSNSMHLAKVVEALENEV